MLIGTPYSYFLFNFFSIRLLFQATATLSSKKSDIIDIIMYYIYGQSGPSLLIESTDSMTKHNNPLPVALTIMSLSPSFAIAYSKQYFISELLVMR